MKKILLIVILLAFLTSISAIEISRPYRAGAYSLILPGAGQIYNREYIKAGAVIGIQTYLIATAVHHNNRKADFQRRADNAVLPFDQQYYQLQADDYAGRLRSDYWWIGITIALSVIDAWIDSHLLDFQAQKERIHLHFEEGQVGIKLDF